MKSEKVKVWVKISSEEIWETEELFKNA